MKHPAVSVLIPVYNAEKFLPACLRSLQEQTFTDFEVLCINDGSKDQSQKILEQFAAGNARFRFINQPNAGVGATRNRLLQEAYGKFIAFVDADDWVAPTYLEDLYSAAQKNQADITRCFFKEWNEQTKKWQKPFCGSSFFRPIGSTPKQRFLAGYYDPVVWGKLYRADFIKKEQIKFLTGATAEDSSFSILTFMTAKRIHTVPKSNYYYRREVPFCITSQKHTMDHGTLHNRLYLCDEFARRGFLTPEVSIALLRCVIGALRQLNKGSACLENDTVVKRAFIYLQRDKEFCNCTGRWRINFFLALGGRFGTKRFSFWAKVFR